MKQISGDFKYVLLLILILLVITLEAQTNSGSRTKIFNDGWSFKKDTLSSGPEKPDFNDDD